MSALRHKSVLATIVFQMTLTGSGIGFASDSKPDSSMFSELMLRRTLDLRTRKIANVQIQGAENRCSSTVTHTSITLTKPAQLEAFSVAAATSSSDRPANRKLGFSGRSSILRHTMVPNWIDPRQWQALTPPADILAQCAAPRTPEKLLIASRAIRVTEAARYKPVNGNTYCNIALSDITQLLGCPISHRDPQGNERTINKTIMDLRAGNYPGWSKVLASEAANRAQLGLPTVAVWLNPKGHGHVAVLVPAPANGIPGHVYVTGAGAACREQCTIEGQFGNLTAMVEFFGHD